jgi:hypothetical protein
MAALTLDELTTLRDNLVRALASGERRVRDSSGEELEYRSVGEMQRALSAIEQRIAAFSSGGAVNTYTFDYSKCGERK